MCIKCGRRMYPLKEVKDSKYGRVVIKWNNCRNCGYKEIKTQYLSQPSMAKTVKQAAEQQGIVDNDKAIYVPEPPKAETITQSATLQYKIG